MPSTQKKQSTWTWLTSVPETVLLYFKLEGLQQDGLLYIKPIKNPDKEQFKSLI